MSTTRSLNLLSAGAAQGLVRALQPAFEQRHGCRLQARFGAVGAMKDALLAGAACDLMVLTDSGVDALVAEARLRSDARASLGRVRTGVAVPAGRPHPEVSTPAGLRAALLAADGIYFPDAQRATAGIHFAAVMDTLGVRAACLDRLREFPNGATAMAEMARSGLPAAMGCTQVSEILHTAGVELVAELPREFELSTLYTVSLSTSAAEPELALHFLQLMAGVGQQTLRRHSGFHD